MVWYRTMVAEQQSSVTGLVVPGNPLPASMEHSPLHRQLPLLLFSPSYIILNLIPNNTTINISTVSKCPPPPLL